MYFWRGTHGPVDLAFTDRYAREGGPGEAIGGVGAEPFDELNLALEGEDGANAENLRLLRDDFAPGATVADMRQVHGATTAVAPTGERPECDALVTADADVVLLVRVADCVPVLLADAEAGVIAAVHCGRPGLVAGVVPSAVARMHELGATRVTGWLGPRVCGACYEVPAAMRAEVGVVVPAAVTTTSWGTPALDIGAGARSQLEALDVEVVDVGACTRESPDLYSYRRDGVQAGRMAGLVRLHAAGSHS